MRKSLLWTLVCLLSFAATAKRDDVPLLPSSSPEQRVSTLEFDRIITLDVEYDHTFLEQHGERVEEVIREAIAIHNLEWRRYRRDWFVLGTLTFQPSGRELDASYHLAKLLHRTVEERDTIHVTIVGRQLEVYTSGTHALAIGGLAYRGSDAVLISAAPGVTTEILAYYLFHELGHSWDAFDLPFRGGDSTFGSKTRITFQIDAGNEEIMEDAAGPLPRDTRGRAPMVIREKLANARKTALTTAVYPELHDLLLHEPSPANPSYVAKKRDILARAGGDAAKIEAVLLRYEITRKHLRGDAEVRQQIAGHYWRANEALREGEFDTAEAELQAIRVLAAATPDVHMLVGAVERKIRRRR